MGLVFAQVSTPPRRLLTASADRLGFRMSLATLSRYRIVRALGVLLVAGATLAAAVPKAQEAPNDEVIAEVVGAFEAGDSDALLSLAAQRIELVLLDQSAHYSRGQAGLVLRDFFRRYPPDRVALSERSVAGDGRAAMGRYWSANSSAPFALYVGFRVTDDDEWQLDAIRVERASFQRTGTR